MTVAGDSAQRQGLAGRTALVTGASSGIGQAIAVDLAQHGAGVVLVGRNRERLEQTRDLLPAQARCTVIAADLGKPDAIDKVVAALDAGQPDLLVHCAGVYLRGPLGSASLAAFDEALRVNVQAVYALTQALLPRLVAAAGDIVFVNSSIVNRATPTTGQFAATQAALRAIADSLREEVNAAGVRVLSVFPGRTATPRQQRIFSDEGRNYEPEKLLQAQDIAATVRHCVTLPASAEVTELSIRPARK